MPRSKIRPENFRWRATPEKRLLGYNKTTYRENFLKSHSQYWIFNSSSFHSLHRTQLSWSYTTARIWYFIIRLVNFAFVIRNTPISYSSLMTSSFSLSHYSDSAFWIKWTNMTGEDSYRARNDETPHLRGPYATHTVSMSQPTESTRSIIPAVPSHSSGSVW